MAAPRAQVAADDAPVSHAAYVTVRDLAALQGFIGRATAQGWVAVEVETDAYDPMRSGLVGVALALGGNDACYVPLAHRAAKAGGGDLFAADETRAEAPVEIGPQIKLGEAMAALKPLLEDPSVLKVGHNMKAALNVFCAQRHKSIADRRHDAALLCAGRRASSITAWMI